MSFLLLALAFGALPIGALLWLKWRFSPRRMQAHADRLLADAEARMERHPDEELLKKVREDAWLTGPVAGCDAAKRVRRLLDEDKREQLAREWPELWAKLLAADARKPGESPRALDHVIDLGAAIAVLARRR
jgi:hypothetical protein